MTIKKPIILSLFKLSWGELDWIAPVLLKLKQMKPKWQIYAVFSPDWVIRNPNPESNSLFNELLLIADKIIFLQRNQNSIAEIPSPDQVKVILNDGDTTYDFYNPIINQYSKFAKVIIHPHGLELRLKQYFNDFRNFNKWGDAYSVKNDLILTSFPLASPTIFDLYSDPQLCTVGVPRFDSAWTDRLLNSPFLLNSSEKTKAATFEKRILFIDRGLSNSTNVLPQDIYSQIIHSLAEIVFADKDAYLFIKTHPRQSTKNLQYLTHLLNQHSTDRWMFSSLQAMQVASLSNITISVTSGSILDSLAVGTPVIEFHPHVHPFQGLTIDQHGRLKSIYDLLGLSHSVRTRDELHKSINDYFNLKDKCEFWLSQNKAFNKLTKNFCNASEKAACAIIQSADSESIDSLADTKKDIQRAWTPLSGENSIFKQHSSNKHQLSIAIKRIKSASMPISSIPLREIAEHFKKDIFIGTGTCNTYLLKEASNIFRDVYLIESNSDLYQAKDFKTFSRHNNVNILTSDQQLEMLLQKISGNYLFFLSSHDGAGITWKSKTNTPVIKELEVISKYNLHNSIILINNIRYFQPININKHQETASIRQYPSLQDALEVIFKINPEYTLTILGDIALITPPHPGITFSPGIHALTISRLFDGNNIDTTTVLQAEKLIAYGLSQNEIESIHSLCSDYFSFEEPGVAGHYYFWQGLTQFGRHDFPNASESFAEAISRNLNHWRVKLLLGHSLKELGDIQLAAQYLNDASITSLSPEIKQLFNYYFINQPPLETLRHSA